MNNTTLTNEFIKPDEKYCIINSHTILTNKSYELVNNLNNNKYYYLDGLLHRENAPAIICKDGYQAWCIHNKYHRLDGPAIIYANGTKDYYINHEYYEENEFWVIQKKCFKCHQEFNNFYDLTLHLESFKCITDKQIVNHIINEIKIQLLK